MSGNGRSNSEMSCYIRKIQHGCPAACRKMLVGRSLRRRSIAKYDAQAISIAFANMINDATIPPKIIESPAFRDFFCEINPRLHLGNGMVLKSDCLELYREERSEIKKILRDRDGRISLSLERLKCQSRDVYMCLIANFVDDSWERKRWVLRVWNVSACSLSDNVMKSLRYSSINDKIFSITTKNGTDVTVEKIKDCIEKERTLPLDGRLFSVRCCADLIDSMLHIIFVRVSDIMDNVHELIDLASTDEHSEYDPIELIKAKNMKVCGVRWRNKLPQWHHDYLMLKEAQELRARLEHFSHYVLSADEWKTIEGVCKLVDKVRNLGKVLFKAKYSSATIFLSNLLEFHVSLNEELKSGDGSVGKIVMKILEKLDKYLENTFLLLAVLAVLDPRCKMLYLEYLSLKFSSCNLNSQLSAVSEAIHTLYDGYAANTIQDEFFDSESSDSDGNCWECEKGNSKCEIDGNCNGMESKEEEGKNKTEKKKEDIARAEEHEKNDVMCSEVGAGCENEDYRSKRIKVESAKCEVEKEEKPNDEKREDISKSTEQEKTDVMRSVVAERGNENRPSKREKVDNAKCEVGREERPKDEREGKRNETEKVEIAEGDIKINDAANRLGGYKQLVQSISQPPKSDLQRYLEEPVEPWSQEFDLLCWWRGAGPKFHVLSKMARDLLSIPLSLVTWNDFCEAEERKVHGNLTSSGQSMLNASVCLQSWRRS